MWVKCTKNFVVVHVYKFCWLTLSLLCFCVQHERAERVKRLEQKKAELAAAMEDMRLQEQARRNALRVQQELAEVRAYDKTFGKVKNEDKFIGKCAVCTHVHVNSQNQSGLTPNEMWEIVQMSQK